MPFGELNRLPEHGPPVQGVAALADLDLGKLLQQLPAAPIQVSPHRLALGIEAEA